MLASCALASLFLASRTNAAAHIFCFVSAECVLPMQDARIFALCSFGFLLPIRGLGFPIRLRVPQDLSAAALICSGGLAANIALNFAPANALFFLPVSAADIF